MDRLRVIQWTTGKVGKLSLRGILDDPRLDLVGVFAHSADKAGQDAGALCGRPETGIVATSDVEALVALKADTVIYTPFMADLDHVVRLLESGADVITTNLFVNLGGVQGEVRETIAAACARGGSSFYVSGINPGWVNAIVVALTAICRDVQGVFLSETADCSTYESKETWLAMGMSMPEASEAVVANARAWLRLFYDATERMAEGLGYVLDEIDFFIEFAKASQDVDLGFMEIPKGTNGAVRGGWNGKVAGKTVVQSKITWYLTKHLAEGWTFEDDHYVITVKGEPEVATRIRFVPPDHWGHHEWDTMTAMPPVNAAFDIKAAAPGIVGLRDAGLPHTPAGLWAAARG